MHGTRAMLGMPLRQVGHQIEKLVKKGPSVLADTAVQSRVSNDVLRRHLAPPIFKRYYHRNPVQPTFVSPTQISLPSRVGKVPFLFSCSDVEDAHGLIAPFVAKLIIKRSSKLEAITGAKETHLCHLQLGPTSAYKIRGAAHFVLKLISDQVRKKDPGMDVTAFIDDMVQGRVSQRVLEQFDVPQVLTSVSAGNHSQAVAKVASMLHLKSIIGMSTKASPFKVESTRALGAEIISFGDTFDAAKAHYAEWGPSIEGGVFVPPFDHKNVMKGQATIALEIEQQIGFENLDMLVGAVGGFGLMSGNSIFAKQVNPNVQVVGVESEEYPSLFTSLKEQRQVSLERKGLSIADGIATNQVGNLCLQSGFLDSAHLVPEEEIRRAVFTALGFEKVLLEGAGATPIAGLLSGRVDVKGKRVALLLSGGNISSDDLTDIFKEAQDKGWDFLPKKPALDPA